MDTDAVLRGVNALLPSEIRVWQVEEVSGGFHARHSAKAKTYQYHIWREYLVSPFQCRYVYVFPYPLDTKAMDEATQQFCGTHDFTAFCATATETEDRVRTVFDAGWERADKEWVFRIRGTGFLQYMVRTIVGTLLYVGNGKLKPADISRIFESRDRTQAGPCVPAHGLHLMDVEY
jgi:tRNA pseudouridine38-40 synthase